MPLLAIGTLPMRVPAGTAQGTEIPVYYLTYRKQWEVVKPCLHTNIVVLLASTSSSVSSGCQTSPSRNAKCAERPFSGCCSLSQSISRAAASTVRTMRDVTRWVPRVRTRATEAVLTEAAPSHPPATANLRLNPPNRRRPRRPSPRRPLRLRKKAEPALLVGVRWAASWRCP